jgi:hypothetical protein
VPQCGQISVAWLISYSHSRQVYIETLIVGVHPHPITVNCVGASVSPLERKINAN